MSANVAEDPKLTASQKRLYAPKKSYAKDPEVDKKKRILKP